MNFIDELNKIDHESIKDMYTKLGNISNDVVFSSYSRILEFVKRSIISKKDDTTLIGIAHVVYGWMPTMLDNIDFKTINDNDNIGKIWNSILMGSMDNDFL